MIINFDSFNRTEIPTLTLCNPGSVYSEEDGTITKAVGVIPLFSDLEIVFEFNSVSTMSFRVYRTYNELPNITDEQKQQLRDVYDKIEARRLIYTEEFGYFSIKECDYKYDEGKFYKDVEAQSVECELENRQIPYIADGTYSFYDMFTKIIGATPMWGLGQVRPEINIGSVPDNETEVIDVALMERYRTFTDVDTTKNCLGFLLEDMQEAYECIFTFNDKTREVFAYDKTAFAEKYQTNIHITKDDIMTGLEINENADDLYTALSVKGADESVTLNMINPLGTSVIYNFNHYLDWMSDELKKKVKRWQQELETEMDYHTPVLADISSLHSGSVDFTKKNVYEDFKEEKVFLDTFSEQSFTVKNQGISRNTGGAIMEESGYYRTEGIKLENNTTYTLEISFTNMPEAQRFISNEYQSRGTCHFVDSTLYPRVRYGLYNASPKKNDTAIPRPGGGYYCDRIYRTMPPESPRFADNYNGSTFTTPSTGELYLVVSICNLCVASIDDVPNSLEYARLRIEQPTSYTPGQAGQSSTSYKNIVYTDPIQIKGGESNPEKIKVFAKRFESADLSEQGDIVERTIWNPSIGEYVSDADFFTAVGIPVSQYVGQTLVISTSNKAPEGAQDHEGGTARILLWHYKSGRVRREWYHEGSKEFTIENTYGDDNPVLSVDICFRYQNATVCRYPSFSVKLKDYKYSYRDSDITALYCSCYDNTGAYIKTIPTSDGVFDFSNDADEDRIDSIIISFNLGANAKYLNGIADNVHLFRVVDYTEQKEDSHYLTEFVEPAAQEIINAANHITWRTWSANSLYWFWSGVQKYISDRYMPHMNISIPPNSKYTRGQRIVRDIGGESVSIADGTTRQSVYNSYIPGNNSGYIYNLSTNAEDEVWVFKFSDQNLSSYVGDANGGYAQIIYGEPYPMEAGYYYKVFVDRLYDVAVGGIVRIMHRDAIYIDLIKSYYALKTKWDTLSLKRESLLQLIEVYKQVLRNFATVTKKELKPISTSLENQGEAAIPTNSVSDAKRTLNSRVSFYLAEVSGVKYQQSAISGAMNNIDIILKKKRYYYAPTDYLSHEDYDEVILIPSDAKAINGSTGHVRAKKLGLEYMYMLRDSDATCITDEIEVKSNVQYFVELEATMLNGNKTGTIKTIADNAESPFLNIYFRPKNSLKYTDYNGDVTSAYQFYFNDCIDIECYDGTEVPAVYKTYLGNDPQTDPEVASLAERYVSSFVAHDNGVVVFEINAPAKNVSKLRVYEFNEDDVFRPLVEYPYYTDTEYSELSNFIFEGSYTDEYVTFTDSMTNAEKVDQLVVLYQRAKEQLEAISTPTQTFNIDTESFIFSEKYKDWTSQLQTGCLINVETREDEVVQLYLTGLTANYEDYSFDLTFGNKFRRIDQKNLLDDLLGGISKSSNSISYTNQNLAMVADSVNVLQSNVEAAKGIYPIRTTALYYNATNQWVRVDPGLAWSTYYLRSPISLLDYDITGTILSINIIPGKEGGVDYESAIPCIYRKNGVAGVFPFYDYKGHRIGIVLLPDKTRTPSASLITTSTAPVQTRSTNSSGKITTGTVENAYFAVFHRDPSSGVISSGTEATDVLAGRGGFTAYSRVTRVDIQQNIGSNFVPNEGLNNIIGLEITYIDDQSHL